MIRSRATVRTDKPDRYGKQLSSHLGRKCAVTEEDGGTRIALPPDRGAGSCLLLAESGALALHASAESTEVLDRVQDVIGRHLERFGQRDGLTVSWVAAE
ncbi:MULTISPECIES: DUF2218 domain-containing protein [Saccharopolyspora]|uniref:DUF2218 domain-containing protein n=1 Tax=Saccharopolyspora cebuensis TaxID=418759 RepID=A0ABV4CJF0_9PSEU